MDDAAHTGGAPSGDGSDVISMVTSTSSFSSALSSSDLDTESSLSFFRERSITLGSLIGIDGETILSNNDRDANLSNNDHAPVDSPHNEAIPMHLPQSTGSCQSPNFTRESGVRAGAKLCRLLSCGACRQLWFINRDTCKVLRCARKGNTNTGPPATAIFSASLGNLLVAERDAERLQERDVDGESNGARVYINIMYEENAGSEQVAINPLFDVRSTSTGEVNNTSAAEQIVTFEHSRRPQNASSEHSTSASFCVEDELQMKIGERLRRTISTSGHASGAHDHQPTLAMKSRKRQPTSLCELGCVSYMWTKCRV